MDKTHSTLQRMSKMGVWSRLDSHARIVCVLSVLCCVLCVRRATEAIILLLFFRVHTEWDMPYLLFHFVLWFIASARTHTRTLCATWCSRRSWICEQDARRLRPEFIVDQIKCVEKVFYFIAQIRVTFSLLRSVSAAFLCPVSPNANSPRFDTPMCVCLCMHARGAGDFMIFLLVWISFHLTARQTGQFILSVSALCSRFGLLSYGAHSYDEHVRKYNGELQPQIPCSFAKVFSMSSFLLFALFFGRFVYTYSLSHFSIAKNSCHSPRLDCISNRIILYTNEIIMFQSVEGK